MQAAVSCVLKEGKGLRDAVRLYNVPVEILTQRVNGSVTMDCKPGPATVLTKEKEDKVAEYLIAMPDMGYGLSRATVMTIAYTIVERSGRKHPFTGKTAGRSWFDGFRKHHPELTICSPLPLSYCRAISACPDTISDLFWKSWSIIRQIKSFQNQTKYIMLMKLVFLLCITQAKWELSLVDKLFILCHLQRRESNIEHLSLCIRFVDENCDIREEFVSFVKLG